MVPSLVELPNGDWIDPRAVRLIRSCPIQDGPADAKYPDRVVIKGDGLDIIIRCRTVTEAKDVLGKVLKAVNDGLAACGF